MTKTFRCKRSGNTVKFHLEGDILSMRKHEGYEEVVDVETTETVQAKSPEAPSKEVLTLKRGRKPKDIPSFLQEQ